MDRQGDYCGQQVAETAQRPQNPSNDGDIVWPDSHQTHDDRNKILVNARGTSSHWTLENLALQCQHGMLYDLSLL